MPRKHSFEFDAAGWLFWIVVFVVLIAPSIYGSWQIVEQDASPIIPISMGVVGSAVGAGVVSWAVNFVLQTRRRKQRLADRKKAKKQK